MTNLVAREMGNGSWFLTNLFVLMMFSHFLYKNIRRRDGSFSIFKLFNSKSYALDIQASVAVTVYFTGATVRAAYIWLLLKGQNSHWAWIKILDDNYWIMFLGAGVGIAGAICITRVFSDKDAEHSVWVACGLAAACIPVALHYWL